MEQRKQARGWHQHFIGSWARLNCENMPVIPAWLVRSNFDDPRRIPYLLVWKDERDGVIKEAVRLARYVDPHDSSAIHNHVELKRPTGVPQFCVSSGACSHETVGELCYWSVPTVAPRAVTSTDGNGIVFRDGQTESGKSVGDAALVLDCATLPKAAICALERVIPRVSETCRGRSRGFLTSLRPSMIPASTSFCTRIVPTGEGTPDRRREGRPRAGDAAESGASKATRIRGVTWTEDWGWRANEGPLSDRTALWIGPKN